MNKFFLETDKGLTTGVFDCFQVVNNVMQLIWNDSIIEEEFKEIKNCVVQMDKQIIFKVRNGEVKVGLDEVIENIMVNSDEFDIKQQTNAVMESYIEHTKLLDISKANAKAFYKQVAKDEELLMKLKKSDTVDELIEIAKDKVEELK